MDSAKGGALEWALALLHAPGMRHALRQRSLPADVDHLLGIAAGASPGDLAEAVLSFNEPEARIREAAQFYVREVLFFPQADAYRVLGVSAQASAASIKTHHRLLQHWLHPDRLHNEDDAVFAARVNAAWNRVRSPERRQAYDQLLLEGQVPGDSGDGGVAGPVRAWVSEVEAPRNPWPQRLPMLALSAACVLLVVLVLRDGEPAQERWGDTPGDPQTREISTDNLAISVPRPAVAIAPEAKMRKGAEEVRNLLGTTTDLPVVAPTEAASFAIEESVMPPEATGGGVAVPQPILRPVQSILPEMQLPITANAPAKPVARPAEVSVTAVAPREHDASPPGVQPVPQAQALPSYERIRQAWAAGDQFLYFMGDVGRPPPPIWSSPGIQSSADRVRQDMQGAGRVRLSGPQWQIGAEIAVLRSDYIVQGTDAGGANGSLTADLVWREGRWLVVGLSIEQER